MCDFCNIEIRTQNEIKALELENTKYSGCFANCFKKNTLKCKHTYAHAHTQTEKHKMSLL